MSEFEVKVVQIGKIGKHPNADTLSITHVYSYPCIIRTGDFQEGDLAIYVCVDAMVPLDDPRFSFLKKDNQGRDFARIKAARLRGIFSMGLLVKPTDEEMQSETFAVGEDVRDRLRITKYEPPPSATMGGDNEHDPGYMVYYDIEGIRKYGSVIQDGEEVVVTEKIHGCNARYLYKDGRLWVASHSNYKKYDETNLWWMVAKKYDLENLLKRHEGIGVYCEVYGQVQNLRYGHTAANPFSLAVFDLWDTEQRRFVNWETYLDLMVSMQLPGVPLLYRGPYNVDKIKALAEGNSTIAGANHVMEGIVVKPIVERWDDKIGRVILKLHGEGYMTSKHT